MRDVEEHEIIDGNGKDVDAELEEKRKRRSFSEETWFYYVRIIFLGFVSCLGLAIASSYILHLILSPSCHWLTQDQLANLKDLTISIVTGAIISQVTTYFLTKK